MNKQTTLRLIVTALVFGTALSVSTTASAVSLATQLAPIYQIGTGAQVTLGHTVVARTNMNRLFAGGTYVAACASSEMLPTTGQRFLPAEKSTGPVVLNVTIPERHPAFVNMPGFNAAAMRGQVLNCTYNWTSRAVESQYSIGVGGIGFTIGGGEANEGSTQLFSMSVPSLGDPNEGSTCIP